MKQDREELIKELEHLHKVSHVGKVNPALKQAAQMLRDDDAEIRLSRTSLMEGHDREEKLKEEIEEIQRELTPEDLTEKAPEEREKMVAYWKHAAGGWKIFADNNAELADEYEAERDKYKEALEKEYNCDKDCEWCHYAGGCPLREPNKDPQLPNFTLEKRESFSFAAAGVVKFLRLAATNEACPKCGEKYPQPPALQECVNCSFEAPKKDPHLPQDVCEVCGNHGEFGSPENGWYPCPNPDCISNQPPKKDPQLPSDAIKQKMILDLGITASDLTVEGKRITSMGSTCQPKKDPQQEEDIIEKQKRILEEEPCSECGGSGSKFVGWILRKAPKEGEEVYIPCPKCGAKKAKCAECGDTGEIRYRYDDADLGANAEAIEPCPNPNCTAKKK